MEALHEAKEKMSIEIFEQWQLGTGYISEW